MEALEHSCVVCRSVFCSVVWVIFSNCFCKCVTAISSQFAKNKETRQFTTLSSLTGNYIAWSFLFVCNVIDVFERKASAFIVCSAQRHVSYMPSCGRTELRLVLYLCIRWRDCFAQSLSWVNQVVPNLFRLTAAYKK